MFLHGIFLYFREVREGIIRCILATDMGRHNEILSQFQEISKNFDYSNQAHVNLVRFIIDYISYFPTLSASISVALYDFD